MEAQLSNAMASELEVEDTLFGDDSYCGRCYSDEHVLVLVT